MREISLHILDLVENSLKAEASKVEIRILEDLSRDLMKIEISDNGRGMDREMVERVCDPFVTSRTERKVGLGLSLFRAAAERCSGDFQIFSFPGKGTRVVAEFMHSHIDRAPLGDMAATIQTIIQANPRLNLIYIHRVDTAEFIFSSEDVRKEVGDAITHPKVLNFIYEFVREKVKQIRGNLV